MFIRGHEDISIDEIGADLIVNWCSRDRLPGGLQYLECPAQPASRQTRGIRFVQEKVRKKKADRYAWQ